MNSNLNHSDAARLLSEVPAEELDAIAGGWHSGGCTCNPIYVPDTSSVYNWVQDWVRTAQYAHATNQVIDNIN